MFSLAAGSELKYIIHTDKMKMILRALLLILVSILSQVRVCENKSVLLLFLAGIPAIAWIRRCYGDVT